MPYNSWKHYLVCRDWGVITTIASWPTAGHVAVGSASEYYKNVSAGTLCRRPHPKVCMDWGVIITMTSWPTAGHVLVDIASELCGTKSDKSSAQALCRRPSLPYIYIYIYHVYYIIMSTHTLLYVGLPHVKGFLMFLGIGPGADSDESHTAP